MLTRLSITPDRVRYNDRINLHTIPARFQDRLPSSTMYPTCRRRASTPRKLPHTDRPREAPNRLRAPGHLREARQTTHDHHLLTFRSSRRISTAHLDPALLLQDMAALRNGHFHQHRYLQVVGRFHLTSIEMLATTQQASQLMKKPMMYLAQQRVTVKPQADPSSTSTRASCPHPR